MPANVGKSECSLDPCARPPAASELGAPLTPKPNQPQRAYQTLPDGPTARWRDAASALGQLAFVHVIDQVTLAHRFAVQAIGAVQEKFMRLGRTPAAVAGAEQNIHLLVQPEAFTGADHHGRMRSGVGKGPSLHVPGLHQSSSRGADWAAVPAASRRRSSRAVSAYARARVP